MENIATTQAVPSYPHHGTQPARLLASLLNGEEVNPLHGWRALGIYRLSDTVLQLRKMGWPVVTNRLDVQNRFGEACHVAAYSLAPEAAALAGLKGIEYAAKEFAHNERRAAA